MNMKMEGIPIKEQKKSNLNREDLENLDNLRHSLLHNFFSTNLTQSLFRNFVRENLGSDVKIQFSQKVKNPKVYGKKNRRILMPMNVSMDDFQDIFKELGICFADLLGNEYKPTPEINLQNFAAEFFHGSKHLLEILEQSENSANVEFFSKIVVMLQEFSEKIEAKVEEFPDPFLSDGEETKIDKDKLMSWILVPESNEKFQAMKKRYIEKHGDGQKANEELEKILLRLFPGIVRSVFMDKLAESLSEQGQKVEMEFYNMVLEHSFDFLEQLEEPNTEMLDFAENIEIASETLFEMLKLDELRAELEAIMESGASVDKIADKQQEIVLKVITEVSKYEHFDPVALPMDILRTKQANCFGKSILSWLILEKKLGINIFLATISRPAHAFLYVCLENGNFLEYDANMTDIDSGEPHLLEIKKQNINTSEPLDPNNKNLSTKIEVNQEDAEYKNVLISSAEKSIIADLIYRFLLDSKKIENNPGKKLSIAGYIRKLVPDHFLYDFYYLDSLPLEKRRVFLEQIYKRNPKDGAYLLAQESEDQSDKLKYAQEYLERDPRAPGAYILLSDYYQEQEKDYDKAIEILERYISKEKSGEVDSFDEESFDVAPSLIFLYIDRILKQSGDLTSSEKIKINKIIESGNYDFSIVYALQALSNLSRKNRLLVKIDKIFEKAILGMVKRMRLEERGMSDQENYEEKLDFLHHLISCIQKRNAEISGDSETESPKNGIKVIQTISVKQDFINLIWAYALLGENQFILDLIEKNSDKKDFLLRELDINPMFRSSKFANLREISK